MTGSPAWPERIAARLAEIHAAGRHRSIRDLDGPGPETTLSATGQRLVSFASNDYLGLATHPAVRAAAAAAAEHDGTGSGASRLIVGARPAHRALEAEIAAWKGAEAALLFPTGYMANLGVLSALGASDDVVVLSDELNHASIIDGARLARAPVKVWRHRDLGDLERLCVAARSEGRLPLVVTDAVFSMDGDLAPVEELVELARRHGALVVLDEAHAVLGPPTPSSPEVIVVGTLSKALGSLGGFAAGPAPVIDLLVNAARSFIFTTAPSPPDTAAAAAALAVLRSPEGDARRRRLRAHVDALRPDHPSPILPVVIGEERDALEAAARLAERGLLVPPIRPPTVAPGTCRLRIALSAAHTGEHVAELRQALGELGLDGRVR